MDIFNKKKLAEQRAMIKSLSERVVRYEQEEERRKEAEGNRAHKTGIWCDGCKNCKIEMCLGSFPTRYCMLDNPCTDREEETK